MTQCSSQAPDSSAGERGAALIIVLLLVASLSFIIVAMTDRLSISVRRTGAVAVRDVLIWQTVGLEAFARQAIGELARSSEEVRSVYSLENPLFRAPVALPVNRGEGEIQFSDGGRCFNVNSLATTSSGPGQSGERDVDQGQTGDGQTGTTVSPAQEFRALVTSIGLGAPEAERLIAVVRDWVDADTIQGVGGAEDNLYTLLPTPYRTGGQRLAEISELRAMDGVNAETYSALKLILCALPTNERPSLNINMLRPQDAPLLVGATGGRLSAAAATDVIASRPPGGWKTVGEFLALPALQPDPEDQVNFSDRFDIRSTFIDVRGTASAEAIDIDVRLLFNAEGGNVRLLRRRIGEAA
ncbi:MAG: type II secretion system minor pseudopilin GspK [Pseudomonadota bacterium]